MTAPELMIPKKMNAKTDSLAIPGVPSVSMPIDSVDYIGDKLFRIVTKDGTIITLPEDREMWVVRK